MLAGAGGLLLIAPVDVKLPALWRSHAPCVPSISPALYPRPHVDVEMIMKHVANRCTACLWLPGTAAAVT